MSAVSISVSAVARGGPTFQPYECHICQRRFTRHENLKRHAALHSRPRKTDSLSCAFCQACFSRVDLRTRHMRRKHPEQDASLWSAAAIRRRAGNGSGDTSGPVPADTAATLPASPGSAPPPSAFLGAKEVTWRPAKGLADVVYQDSISNYPNSTPGSSPVCHAESPGSLQPDPLLAPFSPSQALSFDATLAQFDFSLPQLQDSWLPSTVQIDTGFSLYFTHVSHFVPFLHQPTFDGASAPDYMRLAMLCLAYQYGEDPDTGYEADSGASLSLRCYQRARALLGMFVEDPATTENLSNTVPIVQTYLFLQIFAMLYLPSGGIGSGGTASTMDGSNTGRHRATSVSAESISGNSTASEATSINGNANGSVMHAPMVSLARAGGLMQPLPTEPLATQDLQALWLQFVCNETHKRTLFAVHQLDALWYQLLSIPRSISHLEIKHDLPCPEEYWAAPSSAEWAHRKLVAGGMAGSPVPYAEAVRRFLSSDGESVVVLPPFDAYGAINIAQFLISSAREVSGWSTITGVLSQERLQPLKSSLIALSPSIHPQPETAKATHAALMCEAIWEVAMIELQLWSPAHTGGIVGGSIDALLRLSTQLPPLGRFLCDATTARAVQPHVDWFLHYLEASVSPNLEAPWIPLYAYKAFLIAYQLVSESIPGAMLVVGVEDGDSEGALRWAEKVFRRRERWHVGRVILECLDRLDKS